MDLLELHRSRVDRLPPQGHGQRGVPPGDRILASDVVRDVRVVADRVTRVEPLARRRDRRAARAADDSSEPGRLPLVEISIDVLGAIAPEALQREPDFPFRVMPGEQVGEVFQEGHDQRRVIVPRVAPGDEDGVQSGTGLVEFFVLEEGLRPLVGVGQVEVRRGPDPVILVVPSTDLAQPDVHLFPRNAHVRAGGTVLERDVLDAVGAEQGELADVLLELPIIPGVPGIGAVPVSELVAADRIGRRARRAWHLTLRVAGPHGHLHRPCGELADAEQDAPRVGPDDPDHRLLGAGCVDGEDEAFRLQTGRLRPEIRRRGLAPGKVARPRGRHDDGAGLWPFALDRPSDARTLLRLLDQGRDRGLLRLVGTSRSHDDRRPAKLDPVGIRDRDQ